MGLIYPFWHPYGFKAFATLNVSGGFIAFALAIFRAGLEPITNLTRIQKWSWFFSLAFLANLVLAFIFPNPVVIGAVPVLFVIALVVGYKAGSIHFAPGWNWQKLLIVIGASLLMLVALVVYASWLLFH